MKNHLVLLVLAVFALGFLAGQQFFSITTNVSLPETLPETASIQAFFCPLDACEQQLLSRITAAQTSIDLAIYSFTLDSVSDALVLAYQRGVQVRVLMDAGQASSRYAEDEKLEAVGIPLKQMDLERGIMHNKYIIIDNSIVGTGSFNFSQNASSYNKENLVFISNPVVAEEFEGNFESLWKAS